MLPWQGATVAIAFLSGSLATFVLTRFLTWLHRPRLEVSLDAGGGGYVATSDSANSEELHFLRLLVKNTGRSTVKGCSAYLIGIRRRNSNFDIYLNHEVVEMGWAHIGIRAKDIPVGAFFFLDVVHTRLTQGRSELHGMFLLPTSFVVATKKSPILGKVLEKGTYEIEFLVAADNALPLRGTLVFDFDPKSSRLAFEDNQRFVGK